MGKTAPKSKKVQLTWKKQTLRGKRQKLAPHSVFFQSYCCLLEVLGVDWRNLPPLQSSIKKKNPFQRKTTNDPLFRAVDNFHSFWQKVNILNWLSKDAKIEWPVKIAYSRISYLHFVFLFRFVYIIIFFLLSFSFIEQSSLDAVKEDRYPRDSDSRRRRQKQRRRRRRRHCGRRRRWDD